MLLWASLFCLFFANLVASQFFLPEIFAGYDPRKVLQPLNNRLTSMGPSDNVRVIRALLTVRQTGCPTDYSACVGAVPERSALQFSLFFPSLVAFRTRFGCGHLFAVSLR